MTRPTLSGCFFGGCLLVLILGSVAAFFAAIQGLALILGVMG